jgi:hypothetical protein
VEVCQKELSLITLFKPITFTLLQPEIDQPPFVKFCKEGIGIIPICWRSSKCSLISQYENFQDVHRNFDFTGKCIAEKMNQNQDRMDCWELLDEKRNEFLLKPDKVIKSTVNIVITPNLFVYYRNTAYSPSRFSERPRANAARLQIQFRASPRLIPIGHVLPDPHPDNHGHGNEPDKSQFDTNSHLLRHLRTD